VESQQICNSKITTDFKDKIMAIVVKLLKILYFFVVMIVNEKNLSNILLTNFHSVMINNLYVFFFFLIFYWIELCIFIILFLNKKIFLNKPLFY